MNPWNKKKTRKKNAGFQKRAFVCALWILAIGLCLVLPAAAAESDPLRVVSNLSDFLFSLVRAVGMILLGFSIVQIGLSFKSHDPSQRANGFMTMAGGLLITFAKEIMNLITGG